ncbi:Protein TusB [Zhongshania aliphaticivorans]|uniref:Protein TusB n=1 Tax=Zhongshania aliphaticivorans TaxID=1470434 RepID=A0A5S9NG92_9GAMM|nr:Protein TusB [Zhongshania aliphaticivorans]CAA0096208.1 Protein TusB [Zhongshania aliphaticivorans]
MQLHILNSVASQSRCNSSILADDAILLIENAVVLSTSITTTLQVLVPIYALQDDLLRRGITPSKDVKIIDFLQFVDLCATYKHCLSW